MNEQPRPQGLELFCGAGGSATGYHQAGFDMTGVDIAAQPRFPFRFVQADALEYVAAHGHEYDCVFASPPCQGYTTMRGASGPRLIAETRELLVATDLPYVIENVAGALPYLKNPVRLCGSSFGLGVERHRYFETNWPLLVPPCTHAYQEPRFEVYDHGRWYLSRVAPVYGVGGGKAATEWGEAMGIDWMTRSELAEAIPPAYTRHVGEALMAYLQRSELGGVAV